MDNIILVPTDFSEVCDNAMKQAAEAAKLMNYTLVLLHVIDKDTRAELKSLGKGKEYIEEKLRAKAGEITSGYGVEVEILAVEGDIFATIPEVAQESSARLIFLGTHGKTGMQKLTGSYALKVVTASPVPVIVVQKRPFKPFKDILLPVTSDSGPWEKTMWASFIASNLGATIHLLYIDEEPVKNAVKIATDHFKKEKVSFTEKAVKGSGFAKQVIDYATASNYDLIMIMTNPDKNFTSFILGSYDEEIMFNASQIPVMFINPRKYNWEKIVKY